MIEETGLRCLDECGAIRGVVVYFYKHITYYISAPIVTALNECIVNDPNISVEFLYILSLASTWTTKDQLQCRNLVR